ncbi:MAG: tryptophan 7-halogenase [Planctomycetota bacterium]
MDQQQSDLTILGGGLAGLSLALQVRQELPKAKITVLEKRQHPVPEAAHKVGESTVEVAAHYFGRVLGLRDHILDQQLPKLGLRFFFPHGENRRIEDRLELGGKRYAPCPSYQLDRGRFENFLGDRCREQGIEFVDQAEIKDIEIRRGGGHHVIYSKSSESHELASRWLVDASGRRAFIKRKLNIGMSSPHIASAAWFRFKHHIKIDDWTENQQWHAGHEGKTGRWYSTNHLMGQGYWVWMIPLASGSTSMGIVAGEPYHSLSDINSMDKAIGWLEKHEPQCANAVKDNLDQLQDFRAIKHYAVECKQVFSRHRWGITGEAGFFHDPFYSPGSDFIAFSNTFLTDLIRRDLTGKDFRIRAFSYDRIFKRFYYGTATAYQDQYCMFGNPTVMPVKILWDYLVYWSITGFIFMQGRMCEQLMYLRNLNRLSRLGKLNHFMQDFFRQWHAATENSTSTGSINISEMPIIREMNTRLLDDMNSSEFFRRFAANVAQLETLCCEIVEESGLEVENPFRSSGVPEVRHEVFEPVFHPTPRAYESELASAAG